MSALNVPATVAGLDLAVVAAALERHACNITDAARTLDVPPSDLRRLLWSNPGLQDAAFEMVEARLDLAEKNIAEALTSDDSRRRDAASMFTIRNSMRARRRGWIVTASASVDVNINEERREIIYTWGPAEGDEGEAKRSEIEQQQAEGKRVVSFRWRSADDDDKLIEGNVGPSNKY
jgi:hypothetical protein